MWSMLVVGLLFAAGALYDVLGPEPDAAEATAAGLIAATLIGLFFATRWHRKEAREFQAWLTENTEAIKRGGARYRTDILVTPATEITRYQLALSFVIMSYKVPTRIYVVDHHSTGLVGGVCTALSLVFGWWGIPWGPVFTVQAISRNVRGGLRHTVGDLLPASAPAVAANPGAA